MGGFGLGEYVAGNAATSSQPAVTAAVSAADSIPTPSAADTKLPNQPAKASRFHGICDRFWQHRAALA